MSGLNTEELPDGRHFPITKERYWVIRKPSEQGSAIAKGVMGAENGRMPQEVADYADFTVTYPGSVNALKNVTVDQSGANLTQEEKEILSKVYPILK